MYSSSWAAITKYHKLGSWNNRSWFSYVLEVGVWAPGCLHSQLLGGLSSWLADGASRLCPPAVEKYAVSFPFCRCQPCLVRTHMTSFTFYHLLLLGHSHSWRLRLQYTWFCEDIIQSIARDYSTNYWLWYFSKVLRLSKIRSAWENSQSRSLRDMMTSAIWCLTGSWNRKRTSGKT